MFILSARTVCIRTLLKASTKSYTSQYRYNALKISITSGAIILSSAIPILANAAPSEVINNNAQPLWEDAIEQQQVWQDALQEQRIEALRQSQAPQTDVAPNPGTPSSSSPTKTPTTSSLEIPEPNSTCLNVHRIELATLPELGRSAQQVLRQQAEKISSASFTTPSKQRATIRSTEQCISVADANALVRDITKAYLDAGFFKISIEPRTNDQGIATWEVYVAKIKAIDNQTDLPTARLFGNVIGTPANIAWLDQAVANGERIIEGQLLLDIYPVGSKGEDVRLKVSQQGDIDTISADMQWRYDPDDSYGHHQITWHASLNNLFGQADLTSLSVQQSLASNYGYDEDNQRRSVSVYSIVPNGRWQWSGMLAADQNKRTTALPNSVLEQTGDSWQANLRGDFTLSRNQNSITTTYAQVAHQDVTNELLGSQLDIQSPTLSSARLGMSYTKLFNHRSPTYPNKTTSGAWVVDLSAEKAFGNHDNPATKAGLSDDYLRFILSGFLTHQHTLMASKGASTLSKPSEQASDQTLEQTSDQVSVRPIGYWKLTHELQGQYSEDHLFGVTQQSLGSTYSGVRGIDNVSNSASSGLTLRNTLSFEPMQTSWLSFGAHNRDNQNLVDHNLGNQKLGSHRIHWSPYLGLDYGFLKYANTETITDNSSDAVSGTLGIKLTGYDVKASTLDKRWQLDVSASRAHVDYANSEMNGTQDTEVSAAWQWYF